MSASLQNCPDGMTFTCGEDEMKIIPILSGLACVGIVPFMIWLFFTFPIAGQIFATIVIVGAVTVGGVVLFLLGYDLAVGLFLLGYDLAGG